MDLQLNLRPIKVDDIVSLSIVEETWRGEGLVHHLDQWITVHGAAPGDTVTATIAFQRGRHLGAYVTSFDPPRAPSSCAVFSTCQGCQLWNRSAEDERAFKTQGLAQVIAKFGNIKWPIDQIGWVSANVQAGYRRRGKLFAQGERLGFSRSLDGGVVSPLDCEVLTPSARDWCDQIIDAWSELSTTQQENIQGIAYAASPTQRLLEARVRSDASRVAVAEVLERLGSLFPHDGISAVHQRQRTYANTPVTFLQSIEGLNIRSGLNTWFHPAHQPSLALYAHVRSRLRELAPTRVLDLGCGIGTVSLLAALEGAAVLGIDIDRDAITVATANAESNDLNATFSPRHWKRALRDLAAESERFDLAIINPMREPVGASLSHLGALGVERIIYLGPSPTSASRDMAVLAKSGYAATAVTAVNLYPRTYHTLIIAEMSRIT